MKMKEILVEYRYLWIYVLDKNIVWYYVYRYMYYINLEDI